METPVLKKKISELSKKKLLERAEQYIFSTGLNDAASKLCRLNMRYGLAQMHIIQEKYGFEPNAYFISSPDETISRNSYRWSSGYGYGGKIVWGTGKDKIVFLNTKPNHCGILVGGLWECPDPYELIKNMNEIKSKELYIDNILVNWDFDKSNHFISCFKTKSVSDLKIAPYVFLIHGSAPELRGDKYGIGVYIDQSKNLQDISIEEVTPFGTQSILLDKGAEDYLILNNEVLEFSNKKREIVAKELFKMKFEIICNQPHQFLKDYNSIYLGSNCTDPSSPLIKSNIFPIGLRADLQAYLFKGNQNLSEKTIKKLDLYEKAQKLGLMEELTKANILPHGAGYSFPDIKDVIQVLEYKDQRYFVCNLNKEKKGKKQRLKIVRYVSDLQFEYRRNEIIQKTVDMGLGKIMVKLKPLFSLKA
ncbi:MAG: hypothetical protein BAJALOKI1v1_1170005 [Promethearchaeota archaeon]|nr:MAG: hypothetical protein BAJALOKI1v1_1170005 [Candidatus Lokiarchaeota archaeon]